MGPQRLRIKKNTQIQYPKNVPFKTIQFNINTQFKSQKQFYFKQSSLVYVHSFKLKTVPFQSIQFNINT